MRLTAILAIASLCLTACANTGLRDLRPQSPGPDEFIVEPKKELETPDSFSALPAPTPGAGNRTDNDPLGDAVVALGGRRDTGGAIPASDAALVTAASRYGVTPTIRQELDVADEEFRRGQSRFTQIRIVREDIYGRVYRREALDPRATAESWRGVGASVPSFPPSQ